ncbi:MAG: cysteine--tRNA ligase [Simkaniaceae bacterium]|nr:cysteine--tRNA ligase [Simkaniaceae bacterium]
MQPDEKSIYLKLYNTESRQKEKIVAHEPLKMYTCGPTVYDYAHIGNFRTYVFEDLLRKTLKFFGFGVKQVMNITDVDDKTIKGAVEAHQPLSEYTKKYIDAFFEDLERLNIEKAEIYPKATDHIPEMIAMIQKLLDKGIAYIGKDQSVYFDIAQFPCYGKLSHFSLEDLKANASEQNSSDEYEKDHLADFVLWKAYQEKRDGPIFWDSPFGKGRPGWHIECSAMAIKHLGDTLDIHVGGVDNIFPHHENEIAQSEACTQQCFAKHWLHCEHLLVNGKKMSKSLGNFFTLRDLMAKGFSGKEVRFALLQAHYRIQLNFTIDGLQAAKNAVRRLNDFIERLKRINEGPHDFAYRDYLMQAKCNFKEALADDLNISEALSVIFNLVRDINSLIDRQQISEKAAYEIITVLQHFDQVLGVMLFNEEQDIPEELLEALRLRQEARIQKDFKAADHYRDLIHSHGYIIEDSPEGSQLKKR